MSNVPANSIIRLRGVRHNNLKNFDLDLPLHRLIVITGLSGSGKSSLAFDTLFAEGQRRYIETFSPYARQFFDRMDKPQVDSIEGIPPAIAIEQRNAVRTTRSTVGTMTEICDYLKLLWPHLAQLHCRQCGRPVRQDSPQSIWKNLFISESETRNSECLVTFDLPLSEKLPLEESLALVEKQGYQRLLLPAVEPERSKNGALALREQARDVRPDANVDSARGSLQIVRLDEARSRLQALKPAALTVIQDRVALRTENRARFVEACEQAYHFGKGKLAIHGLPADSAIAADGRGIAPDATLITRRFSNRLHCAGCDIEYREPTPALFSFNHPIGACPACRGFGRIISIDYGLAVPDSTRTLAQGVVKPWLTGQGTECQDDLMKFCRKRKAPTDVPFNKLPRKWQDWVINGDPDYGQDDQHRWPHAWYGVKGYFRWLESKAYKMHVRVLLSRYRAYTPCPDCGGKRFQPEALLYRMQNAECGARNGILPAPNGTPGFRVRSSDLTLADFYALPIRDALKFVDTVAASRHLQSATGHSDRSTSSDPLVLALAEVRSRLGYLVDIGLGYLTLDRPTRSLSGGETERVNLTSCLGTRLVNTLFVLDEPSVGLHPRDTTRLVRILTELRAAGNTVVVVEHEAGVIRAADQIVDLGPEQGERGGQVVFQGTFKELLAAPGSLTGQYLSGWKCIEVPARRPATANGKPTSKSKLSRRLLTSAATLKVEHASRHNLKDVSGEIPLGRFVCVTGVSGSGKTTLVREVLLPVLEAKLRGQQTAASPPAKASERIDEDNDEGDDSTFRVPHSTLLSGWESLSRVVLVDQSALGKTPRSNPAVYVGAFEAIRELFAQSEAARQRGLNASAFSFNSAQGQCERCRGAGFEKIEMQFLSDVFIRCPDCEGRRYRPHILEVKVSSQWSAVNGPQDPVATTADRGERTTDKSWNIADLLEATVNEVMDFLASLVDLRPARQARQSLQLLQDVGLGYLRLGQPINTLSGGECQRLKLVRHLADAEVESRTPGKRGANKTAAPDPRPALFLFDEPTTGLHFDDVRVLLAVFQRLVDAGHSVVVIEHNLEVIKCADWLIDLGPEAGDEGGQIVAQGTPEQVAACANSHTGSALREVLPNGHSTKHGG